jgi:hypothetical protein
MFFGGGQMGEQVPRGLLPQEADRRPAVRQPFPGAHREQVMPGHHRPATGGQVKPREDVQQR